jgi:hypothetical protein
MSEFYVDVPEGKTEFFIQMLDELGYSYEKLFSSNEDAVTVDPDESYFTDSDD